MFRTVPLSINRSLSLYTQQWYMPYSFADSLRARSGRNWFRPDPARKLSANIWDFASRIWTEPVPSRSCSQAVSKLVWHIPLLCVQWKTLDDVQGNYPKHVEFYSKNKFEKLLHLVGFLIRIFRAYHAAKQRTHTRSKELPAKHPHIIRHAAMAPY